MYVAPVSRVYFPPTCAHAYKYSGWGWIVAPYVRMRVQRAETVYGFAAFHSCDKLAKLSQRRVGMGWRRPKRLRLATILPFAAGMFLGTLITLFLVLTLRSIDVDEASYTGGGRSTGAAVMPSTPRSPQLKAVHVHPLSESTRKELIAYSVLVEKSALKTRGLAAHKTWASGLGKRVSFYVFPPGGSDDINFAYKRGIPLIALGSKSRSPNRDGVLRAMLDVCQRDLGKYQWYAKIDDKTYVRPKELESILFMLNSSEPHLIGHQVAPEGRTGEELGLRGGESYCMEMGYVMSARTLQLVCPMLEHCRENSRSENEDVEFARCVRLAAGINCTSSHEVLCTVGILQQLFLHF